MEQTLGTMTTGLPAAPPKSRKPLPLENGDRLTRDEFERRYTAMPEVRNAELIEGMVYRPSPVSLHKHGYPHTTLVTWLRMYHAGTPGLMVGDNGTVRLDMDNEFQPDVFLIISPDCGGQARVDEDDFVEGAPELVAEVAASSASRDLHTNPTFALRG